MTSGALVSSSSTDENKAVATLLARWVFSSCKEIDDAEGVDVPNWSCHTVRMLCLGADFEAETYGADRSIPVSDSSELRKDQGKLRTNNRLQ